jgi:glutathione S-transferase
VLPQSFSEDGSVVWESKDILLALEERFPHASPLLPTDEEEKQKVRAILTTVLLCDWLQVLWVVCVQGAAAIRPEGKAEGVLANAAAAAAYVR